ncbi:MAG: M48 family metallopeptidase [Muribaculaceae bacterium]|nr:M48 family metallopeptidase [Muribaculaceae bacterium]
MIHAQDFIHPEDEAALRNMEAIPGFSVAVKAFLKMGFEKMYHGINMASTIRLSPTQLPKIYNRLPRICNQLGIKEPEFYLQMDPSPNAYTYGDSQIFIVVTSGLLEYLDDEEVDSVIAHECGHIACHHVLYHTMATMLLNGSMGLLGDILAPIKYALLYWQRKSELSCDRAAALITNVDAVLRTQVRLAGGPKCVTDDINIEEWATQAERYEDIRDGGLWNKTLQVLATMNNSHPFAAVRVREILLWSRSEQYRRIINNLNTKGESSKDRCPNCGNDIDSEWQFCRHCGTKLK